MGNRLSKIVTRTGDDGSTGLADGSRLSKAALRVAAMGEVDELNSAVGLLLAHDPPADLGAVLTAVQHHLFDLGGELATPGRTAMTPEHALFLEEVCEELNADLPPLKEFILPGGSAHAAICHLARAVCRRAERAAVALASQETVNPAVLVYLNRLSDVLFVMARVINRARGGAEVYWQPAKGRITSAK